MQPGTSLVVVLSLTAFAFCDGAGSGSDSGLEASVARQQMELETEGRRGDAYDADDEETNPERRLPTIGERGKCPRQRLHSGRALRPAPFCRGAPVSGPLEVGLGKAATVPHRAGVTRPAFQRPEEAPLDLVGLVPTAEKPANKGMDPSRGPDCDKGNNRERDHVPAWSMEDASESTTDELDRACRLPVGSERRRAFSAIREKIKARKRRSSKPATAERETSHAVDAPTGTWNPFTLLSKPEPSVLLGFGRSYPPRAPSGHQLPVSREAGSERRIRTTTMGRRGRGRICKDRPATRSQCVHRSAFDARYERGH